MGTIITQISNQPNLENAMKRQQIVPNVSKSNLPVKMSTNKKRVLSPELFARLLIARSLFFEAFC